MYLALKPEALRLQLELALPAALPQSDESPCVNRPDPYSTQCSAVQCSAVIVNDSSMLATWSVDYLNQKHECQQEDAKPEPLSSAVRHSGHSVVPDYTIAAAALL